MNLPAGLLEEWNEIMEIKQRAHTICLQEAQTFQAKGEQTEAEAGMGGTEVEPERVGVGQPGWMAEPPQASW